MEWAIGKGYDLFREGTGKLILPGEKISWDQHIHASGEETKAGSEIGIWFYPKGQEPKKRSYLIGFTGLRQRGFLDIAPNSISHTEGFTVLKENTLITNFQPHFHLRGKAMQVEAILPDGSTQIISYVDNFNFNWMTNYIYDDDAAPVFPKGTVIHVSAWYDNTNANKNNPDPGPVGRLRRPHGRRDGARVDERRLPERRRIQGAASPSAKRRRRKPLKSASSEPSRESAVRRRGHRSPAAFSCQDSKFQSRARRSARASPARSKAGITTPTAAACWLVGYLNRNFGQALDVPIGPNNRIEPGGPDMGQPTHFLPGRNWGMFTVPVPKDFKRNRQAHLDDRRQRAEHDDSAARAARLRRQPVQQRRGRRTRRR